MLKKILTGTAIGLTLGVIVGEAVARAKQRALLADKNRYLHDITPSMFPNSACACCGGTASHLRLDKETKQLVCKDRPLCRSTMIFTNLMEQVEDAE